MLHLLHNQLSVTLQAWSFACAVRALLGLAPNMSMENFPYDVWKLHRKIHHRYLRFVACFKQAEEQLQEYVDALNASPDRETSRSAKATKKSGARVSC